MPSNPESDTRPTRESVDEGAPSTAAAAPLVKGIVVGVDGSPLSVDALRYGAQLASALGLPLRAVTAWEPQQVLMDYGESDGNPELAARQAAFDISKFVFGDHLPTWFSSTIEEGAPAGVLINSSFTAGMLIVGSHGHSGFIAGLIGSVSTSCTAHAHCPVLVYRATTTEE